VEGLDGLSTELIPLSASLKPKDGSSDTSDSLRPVSEPDRSGAICARPDVAGVLGSLSPSWSFPPPTRLSFSFNDDGVERGPVRRISPALDSNASEVPTGSIISLVTVSLLLLRSVCCLACCSKSDVVLGREKRRACRKTGFKTKSGMRWLIELTLHYWGIVCSLLSSVWNRYPLCRGCRDKVEVVLMTLANRDYQHVRPLDFSLT
jgi:hypothetical protein